MTTADAPALSHSSAPGRWVLAITVLGSGIASLDASVVNIALPTIGRDFHTGVAALQWVMNGYTLTLTAFLLVGGSLGDRFGRRKVYLTGIVWFTLASVACGLAPGAAEWFWAVSRTRLRAGAVRRVLPQPQRQSRHRRRYAIAPCPWKPGCWPRWNVDGGVMADTISWFDGGRVHRVVMSISPMESQRTTAAVKA